MNNVNNTSTADPRKRLIKSVYFGGGTPSLSRPELVEKILKSIKKLTGATDIEVTIEANPNNFEIEKLKDFKDAGVNRLSLGLQALNDIDLKFFNRNHTVSAGRLAVHKVKEIYDNVSLDFIWGRPGQKLRDWKNELEEIISFRPSHLSLYQLTVDRGTALYNSIKNKSIVMPNDDEMADIFETTIQLMNSNGYEHYEISSFSKADQYKSQHNQSYWNGADYFGVGPGAHGRVFYQNIRTRTFGVFLILIFKILSPKEWMDQCENIGHGVRKIVSMTNDELGRELIIFGLRMRKGIQKSDYQIFTNGGMLEDVLDMAMVRYFEKMELLECSWIDGKLDHITTTCKGFGLADSIGSRILNI